MADSDKTKTIDGFAYWIENEENGVCYIPLNLCKKIMELLKEQEAVESTFKQCEDGVSVWACGSCGACMYHIYDGIDKAKEYAKYCRQCGKKVKWE